MIRGLWDRQEESIIDVRLGDADTHSYKYEPMAVLSWFDISDNGMLGREPMVLLAQLS